MNTIPAAHLLGPIAGLDYVDCQSIELPRATAPLEAWNTMMAQPQPILKLAFRIRDAISSLFGVKAIGGFSGRPRNDVKVGDHLDFFLVEGVAADVLILTARDVHLDVMTCVSTQGRTLTITSSVRNHNWFGHVYMLPVGLAHKVIVRRMLKRLRADLIAAR